MASRTWWSLVLALFVSLPIIAAAQQPTNVVGDPLQASIPKFAKAHFSGVVREIKVPSAGIECKGSILPVSLDETTASDSTVEVVVTANQNDVESLRRADRFCAMLITAAGSKVHVSGTYYQYPSGNTIMDLTLMNGNETSVGMRAKENQELIERTIGQQH